MQVNRVNQQTNFGSAYAKLNGKWLDLSSGAEQAPTVLKKVCAEAVSKKGLLLGVDELRAKVGNFWRSFDAMEIPVVLTGKEEETFDLIKTESGKRYLFNSLFENRVQFGEDLNITQVENAQFTSHIA